MKHESQLRHCHKCGADYQGDTCPYCGKEGKPASNGLLYAAAGLGGGLLLLGCLGMMAAQAFRAFTPSDRARLTQNTVQTGIETESTEEKLGVYPSGDYAVGSDLPPGSYIIVSEGHGYGDFYTGIYDNAGMSDSGQIWGGWAKGNRYLVLGGGQYLHFSHSTLYELSAADFRFDPYTEYGMFLIGQDLPAGTYTLFADNDQYSATYQIITSLTTSGEIVREDGYLDPGRQATVTVEDGEYLRTDFCLVRQP